MTYSFRKPAVWFSFAVLTIAILYCGMWYVAGTILRQQAEAWFQSRQTENLAITYNAPTLSGFPGRIGVDFPGFSIAAPRINNTAGWSWRSDTLRLFLHPFAFQTVHADLSGAHILAGIRDVPLLLTLARGETSFAFTQERLTAITADISGLSGTWQNETAADFSAEKIDLNADVNAPQEGALPTSHVILSVSAVTLPDTLPKGLSRTLQSASLTLDVHGPIANGPLPVVLDAWRSAGGDIDVRNFAANWPPVTAAGSGTVALDANLQPMGAFTAKFQGFLEVVDMLVAQGRMETRDASAARGILSLLAKTPEGGGAPELSLAVTAQDRTLYAGPITLLELPEIIWPANVVIP